MTHDKSEKRITVQPRRHEMCGVLVAAASALQSTSTRIYCVGIYYYCVGI